MSLPQFKDMMDSWMESMKKVHRSIVDVQDELENIVESVEKCLKKIDKKIDLLDPEKKKKRKSESDAEDKPAKKKKKVKRVGEPKRPLSAYMLYVQKNRCEYVARQPDAKMTDIAKMLGTGWANMNEEEKKVYHDMASWEKDRYAHELQQFDLAINGKVI